MRPFLMDRQNISDNQIDRIFVEDQGGQSVTDSKCTLVHEKSWQIAQRSRFDKKAINFYIMPPIPPPIPPISGAPPPAPAGSGLSATIASVVIIKPETDAAF